uniref:Uncharacterized protein n=1 Tax=viral metagenome TaxID=1070528 RepID=A0A6H1ZWC9_9ZZZZ
MNKDIKTLKIELDMKKYIYVETTSKWGILNTDKSIKRKINIYLVDIIRHKNATVYITSPFKYTKEGGLCYPYNTWHFDQIGSIKTLNFSELPKDSWILDIAIYPPYVEYFNENEFDFIFEIYKINQINNEISVFAMHDPYNSERAQLGFVNSLCAIPKKLKIGNSIATINDLNKDKYFK